MSDDPALGLELDDDSPQQGAEVSDPLIRKGCVLSSLQGKGFIFFFFLFPTQKKDPLSPQDPFAETCLGKSESSIASHTSTGSWGRRNNETPYC